MKFRPTACWRIWTSPGPGAGTSTGSYTRASGPPTLCTRTALVISNSPSAFPLGERKPSRPHCQQSDRRASAAQLVNGLFAIAFGEHVEGLDQGRERDCKIDVAARDVKLESVGD